MPRYEDRGPTRLYVGRLSTRTRSRDLEELFSKYGRVREVDVKHDFAFVEFNDHRDADYARHYLNGKDFEGHHIVVEFARRRGGGGGSKEYSRGPVPGTTRCYNCGNDGHWARDCKAGDCKDKCYRCGQRGHIERNCRTSPRSYQRSRSRSPVRRRSRSRSLSRSRSRSPRRRDRSRDRRRSRSRSISNGRHNDRDYHHRREVDSPVPGADGPASAVVVEAVDPEPIARSPALESPTTRNERSPSRSRSPSPSPALAEAEGNSREPDAEESAAANRDED